MTQYYDADLWGYLLLTIFFFRCLKLLSSGRRVKRDYLVEILKEMQWTLMFDEPIIVSSSADYIFLLIHHISKAINNQFLKGAGFITIP